MTPADEVKRNAADTSDPDRVYSVVNNQTAIGGIEEVSTSWRRCLSEHGVDPSSNKSPRILTDYELKVVGITSQREIERVVREGKVEGTELKLRMTLTAENAPLNHVVEETIDLR